MPSIAVPTRQLILLILLTLLVLLALTVVAVVLLTAGTDPTPLADGLGHPGGFEWAPGLG